jgi:Domain of unknown function (DUF4190)/GYF domain 2
MICHRSLNLTAMSQWFYSVDNQQAGPVTDAELHGLVATGRVLPATLVWRDGMPKWMEFSQLSTVGTASLPPSSYHGGMSYPTTSGYAIASLIFGIIGLISCLFFLGLPAVILGHIAMHQIDHAPRNVSGRGMAITGLICGYLGILLIATILVPMCFAIAKGL